MKSRIFTLAALTAAVSLLPAAGGAQVVSDKARQNRLEDLARVLDAAPIDYEAILKDCRDPFYPVDTRSFKTVDQKENVGAVSEVVDYGRVFAVAASSIRATGTMSRAGRQMIVGSGGDLFDVGSKQDVEMDSVIYEVLIQSADQNGYTLSIEAESVTIPYADSPSTTSQGKALR